MRRGIRRRREPAWRSVVATSGLGDAVRRLLERVIGGARVSDAERLELAEELVAHFEDAQARGLHEAEAIQRFGDEALAARLIGRAKRRCRGPAAQASLWAIRLLAAAVMLLLFAYATLAWRYYTVSPRVTVDYLEPIREVVRERTPEGGTWRAWIELWKAAPASAPSRDSAGRTTPEELVQAAPWLDRVRALAGAGGGFGWPMDAAPYPEAWADLERQRSGGATAPVEAWDFREHNLLDVLLPYLRDMRQTALWLALDASAAVEAGDSARFVTNCRAVLVLGEHAAEAPLLINWLSGGSIREIAFERIIETLGRRPGFLDAAQLAELAEAVAAPSNVDRLPLDGELALQLDLLQRLYSDDGSGDGRITAEGRGAMRQLWEDFGLEDFGAPSPIWSVPLAAPVAAMAAPTRKAARREIERVIGALEAWGALPAWERRANPQPGVVYPSGDPEHRAGHVLLRWFLPAIPEMFHRGDAFRMARDAALVSIAAAGHHAETGRWPASLEALTPRRLATVPLDPVDGRPLRYALSPTGPVLYSLGADWDDDGGAPAADDRMARQPGPSNAKAADGDVVLFRVGGRSPEAVEPED